MSPLRLRKAIRALKPRESGAQESLLSAGVVARLVLNLDRPFVFATSLEGKELLITLRRPRSGAVRDAMRGSDDSVPDVPRHGLLEVGFQRGAIFSTRSSRRDMRKALRVRSLAWLGMNQPMMTELSATNATICVPPRSAAED